MNVACHHEKKLIADSCFRRRQHVPRHATMNENPQISQITQIILSAKSV